MKTLTNTRINDIHQRMVFRFLWRQGRVSRSTIRDRFGFSKSTVSALVNSLIDRGLMMEDGITDSSLGRKPRALSLSDPGPGLISVIMKDSGELTCALVDLRGSIRLTRTERLGSSLSPVTAIDTISELIHMIFTSSSDDSVALGVGLGVPGIVNSERGVVEYSAHYSWTEVPVEEMVKARLEQPVPVTVENRTVAATLGEMWYGRARNSRNLVMINLGDALGAGIVIGGKVYRGGSCGVGEIGHIQVPGSSELCSCGKRGCLETVVALPAIMKKLDIAYPGEQGAVQILKSRLTEKPVREALDYAYRCLGEAAAVLINLLTPESMYFAGALIRLEPKVFLQAVRERVNACALGPLARGVELSLTSLEEKQEALWGGAVVLEHLFGVRPVT